MISAVCLLSVMLVWGLGAGRVRRQHRTRLKVIRQPGLYLIAAPGESVTFVPVCFPAGTRPHSARPHGHDTGTV